MHHLNMKQITGSNKSNEKLFYPNDDPEIAADDRLTPAHAKLAYRVVMMGCLWPEICTKGKGYIVQTNYHVSTEGLHASQELIFNQFGTKSDSSISHIIIRSVILV